MGIKKTKRDATRPRFSGRHDDFGATTVNASAPSVAPFTKPRRPIFAIVISARVIVSLAEKLESASSFQQRKDHSGRR